MPVRLSRFSLRISLGFTAGILAHAIGLAVEPHVAEVTFGPAAGPAAKRAVYTAAESPELEFRLESPNHLLGMATCRIEIVDFWGDIVDRPVFEIEREAAALHVRFKPHLTGTGWFFVRVILEDENGAWTVNRHVMMDADTVKKQIAPFGCPMFAIVPVPRRDPARGATPIGVDVGITGSKPTNEEALIELAPLTGASWVRDRISWAKTEPEPDRYDFSRPKRNAERLYRQGQMLLQTFNGAPEWSREPNTSFPDDLRVAYRFARAAGKALGPGVKAWEIWNEPDIAPFCKEPPDAYAALVKAMALGFRAASPQLQVHLGPFARNPEVGDYAVTLFANQITPYLDGYDFHTYASATKGPLDRVLATHLKIAGDSGFGEKSIWLTETAIGYHKANPPADLNVLGEQIRHLFAVSTRALSQGVRPVFWFYLQPYFEAKVEFGLVDPNFEPFPIFPALATMNAQLGSGKYIGQGKIGATPVFFFQNPQEAVGIVMSELDYTEFPTTDGKMPTCIDPMGNPLPVVQAAGNWRVTNHRWPFYVHGLSASNSISPAMPAGAPSPAPASSLVLRIKYPRAMIQLDEGRTELNWDTPAARWAPRGYAYRVGEPISLQVEVYNFGATLERGHIEARLPPGVRLSGEIATFGVPPNGRVQLAFMVIPTVEQKMPVPWTFEALDENERSLNRSVSQWSSKATPQAQPAASAASEK